MTFSRFSLFFFVGLFHQTVVKKTISVSVDWINENWQFFIFRCPWLTNGLSQICFFFNFKKTTVIIIKRITTEFIQFNWGLNNTNKKNKDNDTFRNIGNRSLICLWNIDHVYSIWIVLFSFFFNGKEYFNFFSFSFFLSRKCKQTFRIVGQVS